MKKTSLLTPLMTTALMAAIVISGCKKENSNSDLTPEQEKQAATLSLQSQTETDFVSNDVFDNVIGVNNEEGMAGTGVFGRLATTSSAARDYNIDSVRNFTVTITRLNAPAIFPVQVVVDFGAGVTGKDGHTRYGKISTIYTGRLTETGKSATTTFDGYKIDSISVQGTHVITNTTSGNQRQFTVDVTSAKLTKANGNYSEWNTHRVLTQTEGNGTPLWPIDDIFTLSGTANGKVKAGNTLVAWTAEITDPLTKKFICPWIVKGILKVRRETLAVNSQWVASLNYGSGDCDNKAILTINGTDEQITLH